MKVGEDSLQSLKLNVYEKGKSQISVVLLILDSIVLLIQIIVLLVFLSRTFEFHSSFKVLYLV